ncbi:MAG: hypothetical protein FWH10_06000 [Oscillospiraceae bacterium]|nr:hypothetical protein [Oscillospiraceae bacterium]
MGKEDKGAIFYNYGEIADELLVNIDVHTKNGNEELTAVIDTGSTYSHISKKFIKSLKPEFVHTMRTYNKIPLQGYCFDIHFSEEFILKDCTVFEMPHGYGDDFLIGMDIIKQGDLAVSNYENQTSVTFRKPSEQRICFCNA